MWYDSLGTKSSCLTKDTMNSLQCSAVSSSKTHPGGCGVNFNEYHRSISVKGHMSWMILTSYAKHLSEGNDGLSISERMLAQPEDGIMRDEIV